MKTFITALLLWLGLAVRIFAADDSAFLLPLGLMQAPGAFGSVWQTELAVRSTSSVPIQLYHAGSLCVITCSFPFIDVPAGASVRIAYPESVDRVASRSGLVLHAVAQQVFDPRDIHFGFRVRDLSRNTLTWGTEIPVIRAAQLTDRPIHLLNVPTSTAFRFLLRIYALEGETPIQATVRVTDATTGAELRAFSVSLDRAPSDPATYYPAYTQFDSIGESFSGAGDAVNLEIASPIQAQKLWSFVSITNNETQQVTIVTPQ